MTRIKSVFLSCLIGALIAGPLVSGSLWAGPIPLSPSPVPSAGESLLNSSFPVGLTSSINIDWEVIPTDETGFPPGLYAYYYQIQNTTAGLGADGVDAFAVTIPAAAFASIVQAGNLGGDDLHQITAFHPPFNAAFFPILATAQPTLPLQPLGATTVLNPADNTVTWTFPPLASGASSDTLYFLSSQPPVYGNAVAQDSIPPSPWATLVPGSQPVPVPSGQNIPEPGTFVLCGLAMVALAVVRRVKR
jgi:hypothetical protein